MSVFIAFIIITQLVIIGFLWVILKRSLDLATKFSSSNSDALTKLTASGKRIEAAAAVVAQDLADAHLRGDSIEDAQHGQIADEAVRPTEKERANANK
jgi:hypothetical protein